MLLSAFFLRSYVRIPRIVRSVFIHIKKKHVLNVIPNIAVIAHDADIEAAEVQLGSRVYT